MMIGGFNVYHDDKIVPLLQSIFEKSLYYKTE